VHDLEVDTADNVRIAAFTYLDLRLLARSMIGNREAFIDLSIDGRSLQGSSSPSWLTAPCFNVRPDPISPPNVSRSST
jgi:hypothetical protein